MLNYVNRTPEALTIVCLLKHEIIAPNVIPYKRAEAEYRTCIDPQPASFSCLDRGPTGSARSGR